MKKILLFIATAILVSASCKAQSGYKATGTVEGFKTNCINIITYHGRQPDTLAKATVADGKFQFSGKIKDVTVAYIVMEGTRGGLPILLEDNTSFTITLNSAKPQANHVEGGDSQKLFNVFRAMNMEVLEKQGTIQRQLGQAMQAKDTVLQEKLKKEFSAAYENYQTAYADFLQKNSDTYVAAYLVVCGISNMSIDKLKEQYALLGENAKKTEMGKEIADYIRKKEQFNVGQVVPDFTLTTPEGKTITLYGTKGKVKLVDFWASWCGPCRDENPNVVAIYNEFHDKGLEIIGISLDDKKDAWVKAIGEDKLAWIQCSDLKGVQSGVALQYNVTSIPRTFLLDENNRVIATNLRGDALKAKIAELLK